MSAVASVAPEPNLSNRLRYEESIVRAVGLSNEYETRRNYSNGTRSQSTLRSVIKSQLDTLHVMIQGFNMHFCPITPHMLRDAK